MEKKVDEARQTLDNKDNDGGKDKDCDELDM